MDKLLDLEIVSPVKSVYNGKVKSVTAPGVLGQFQVLFNHAAMVANLEIGIIKIEPENGDVQKFATSGGVLEVRDNKISVLAETLETKNELDKNRAESALDRNKRLLDEHGKDFDRDEVMLAIKRAKNRLSLVN